MATIKKSIVSKVTYGPKFIRKSANAKKDSPINTHEKIGEIRQTNILYGNMIVPKYP